MDMKTKISRQMLKATCDKTGMDKKILDMKKRFDEAGKMIGGDKKGHKKH